MLERRLHGLGTWWSQCAWAYVRRDADQRWQAVDLGSYSDGCVVLESDPLEPGRHELLAWLPERGLAFRAPRDVPARRGDARLLEVEVEDPRTLVRGTSRMTCAGLEAWDWRLDAWLRPRSAQGVAPSHASDVFRAVDIGFAGTFELRGVPPDVHLELEFRDGGRVVARRSLRVARGETLELGIVEAVLR